MEESEISKKGASFYEEIGLKSGIEIHQQLEGKKLFCSCPSTIKEGEPDLIIKRKLRAVAG
ncbi:MAG: hypothetical protein NTV63_03840, partial [Candidatus Woesearchaeota archaeon]|nr:hypothetical protein [Candidatus Woesearchaeota archaeon]